MACKHTQFPFMFGALSSTSNKTLVKWMAQKLPCRECSWFRRRAHSRTRWLRPRRCTTLDSWESDSGSCALSSFLRCSDATPETAGAPLLWAAVSRITQRQQWDRKEFMLDTVGLLSLQKRTQLSSVHHDHRRSILFYFSVIVKINSMHYAQALMSDVRHIYNENLLHWGYLIKSYSAKFIEQLFSMVTVSTCHYLD